MTSQTQSNIQVIQLLLLLFCPVFDVAPSREENNTRLGEKYDVMEAPEKLDCGGINVSSKSNVMNIIKPDKKLQLPRI
jgi:hypothetical protein